MSGRNGNWSTRNWTRVDDKSASPSRTSRSRSVGRYSISPLRTDNRERAINRSSRNRSRSRSRERQRSGASKRSPRNRSRSRSRERQGSSRRSSSRSPRRRRRPGRRSRERARPSPGRSSEVVKVVQNQEIIVHSNDPYDIDNDNRVDCNEYQYSPPPPPSNLDFGFNPNGENDGQESDDVIEVKEDSIFDDCLKKFTEIPVFDPATSPFTPKQWLKIVDTIVQKQGLTKQEKKYAMSVKLAGAAKQWYISVNKPETTYIMIQKQFLQAFRSDMDYYNSLKLMMDRNKKPDESYASYFDDKTTLLEMCEITGRRAISCLIGGLGDANLKEVCFRQNFAEVSHLYDFLRKQAEEAKRKTKSNQQKRQPQQVPALPAPEQATNQPPTQNPAPSTPQGDTANPTPKALRRRRCIRCRRRGHMPNDCPVPNDELPPPRVMWGELGSVPTDKRCYAAVLVNGTTLKAYIDVKSEHTTIREDAAQRCNITSLAPLASVSGFSGVFIPANGQSRATICVDQAIAVVTVCIVPNNVQAISIIIGRSFIDQPDITMIDDADGIRMFQKQDGQINYQSATLLYQNLGQVPYTPFDN